MTGGITRYFALACALGLASLPALAEHVVDPASARQAIENPVAAARDAELSALAAGGRATELAARLELIAHDATLTDVAQEWLLDRGLHALVRIAPTREARATVARLVSRVPVVYARVDPDHGNRATPLYDAGATARFVLRSWERNDARATAQAELAAGLPRAVDRYAQHAFEDDRDPVLEGIAEAFRNAPISQLAAQGPAVSGALAQGQRVDALALILAERFADPSLFGLIFDNAGEATALAAIPAATRALDASSALAALARASQRTDVGSAAVLEIGRLAQGDPAARSYLFDALAKPGIAPSAAAALGRISDPAVSAEVGQRLSQARSEDERRLLVLALRLDANPAAHVELERFAESGAGSPKLQKEVRQWLAH
jgi:hypothetical protein